MTPRTVEIGADARRDLDNYVLWLRSETDAETAVRFAKAATRSFANLADTPGLGPASQTANPQLNGMRKWRVEGFRNVLIFYLPLESGVRIVRVVHAAADWWSLFGVN